MTTAVPIASTRTCCQRKLRGTRGGVAGAWWSCRRRGGGDWGVQEKGGARAGRWFRQGREGSWGERRMKLESGGSAGPDGSY
eukprot:32965-Chlamydomonas_euryale.AAC.1